MPKSFYNQIPDVTIPIGASVSNIVRASTYDDAVAISLIGPASLDAHTFVIEVNNSTDAAAADTDWVVLQAGDTPADVGPPDALKARVYQELCFFGAFRIKDQTGNVAAERTWQAQKQWTT
jgi:hypothetical protein